MKTRICMLIVWFVAHGVLAGEFRTLTVNGMPLGTATTSSVPLRLSEGDGVRAVCTGWTGTGSVPSTGNTNTVVTSVTEDSSLTWTWETQYLLDTSAGPNGLVAPADGWYAEGSAVTVTAVPDAGYEFDCWVGYVPEGMEETNPLELTMDIPRVVMAVFEETASFLDLSWRFEEGAGSTAAESSGSGHDGVLDGPAWANDASPVSGGQHALWFDGVDDSVMVPDDASLRLTQAVTLQAWVKREGEWSDAGRIICKRDDVSGSGYGFDVLGPSGKLRVHLRNNDTFYSNGTVPTGVWTHVAATYDSGAGSAKLYIGGALDSEWSTSQPLSVNSLALRIGRQGNGGSHFEGKIDEAKVYGYARSAAEIAADAGLVACWKLDDGSGSVAADSSGNGHDGTIHGAEWGGMGEGNHALSFDGAHDYVAVPYADDLVLETFTIEVRLKLAELGRYQYLLMRGGEGHWVNHNYELYISAQDKVGISYEHGYNENAWLVSESSLTTGRWYHVAGTYDGQYLRVYIDGVLEAEQEELTPPQPTHAHPLYIAGHQSSVFEPSFHGLIAEVSIYNYARAIGVNSESETSDWDFVDTFEDGNADGWAIAWLGTYYSETWAVTSPGRGDSSYAYRLSSVWSYGGGAVTLGHRFREAECWFNVDNWVADIMLYPRYVDEDNYMQVRFYPLGTDGGQLDAIEVRQNGVTTAYATHSRTTSLNTWHRIRYVLSDDGGLVVYLDGQPYLSAAGLPEIGGNSAVGIYGGGRFDDFRGRFTPPSASDMPEGRTNGDAVASGGKIYYVGGYTADETRPTSIMVYDPATDTWSMDLAEMPTARNSLGAAEVDGVIYAAGGHVPGSDLSAFEAYDIGADMWSGRPVLPNACASISGAVLSWNGKVYVAGGNLYATDRETIQIYNPDTDSWSESSSSGVGRRCVAAAVVDGIIYVIGGADPPPGGPATLYAIVKAYDIAGDTWHSKPSLPAPRNHAIAIALDGCIYVFGGYSESGGETRREILRYTPATDQWQTVAGLPDRMARRDMQVVRLGNLIYLIGGKTDDGQVVADVDVITVCRLLSGDVDADGLPDTWELAAFGSLDVAGDDPCSDCDDDGASDRDEYTAGTCPTNGHDCLQIMQIDCLPNPGTVLSWNSVTGRLYTVYTASMPSGPWTGVHQAQGSGTTQWFTNTDHTCPAGFFRVGVEMAE